MWRGLPARVKPAGTATSANEADELHIHSRGRLPHWERDGATYFVTFRLADSIPKEAREAIRLERDDIVRTAEHLGRELSESEKNRLDYLHSERIEELLHAGSGSCALRDDRCARIVAECVGHFHNVRYDLFAWCVMPNHVHAVFQARADFTLGRVVHGWKSFTANRCNKILGRTGPFWMEESFDRLVRNESELQRFVAYTLENPLKAGLLNWTWLGRDPWRP
jgi:REP element-mobilizing transposase RayT